MPKGAGVPKPITPAEQEATADYLGWLSDLAAWGRAGWKRAETAKDNCARLES